MPGRRTTSRTPKRDSLLDKAVEQKLLGLRATREAQSRLAAELALSNGSFQFPPAGRTLAHALAEPPQEVKYAIDELHPAGSNSLMVAGFKAGKTTVLLNLMKSLADGEPFLGRFEVMPLEGRVAFWNYELDKSMFTEWMRAIDVQHPERIAEPLHLRGTYLPLWIPEVAEVAAEWLRKNEIEFLIIDPAARAWKPLVENENDNAQVGTFTDALDALKLAAGVPNLVVATHTGRQEFAEGEERTRGATRLEDWMDAGWYLTKDGEKRRAIRAMGRDVEVEALDLAWDGGKRRMTATGQTRSERRETDGQRKVLDALVRVLKITPDTPWDKCPTTSAVQEKLAGTKSVKDRLIPEAQKAGLIERKEGPNRSQRCRPTAVGMELHRDGWVDPRKAPTATRTARRGHGVRRRAGRSS